MIGLLILGIAAGWVLLWVYVFKKARNRPQRVLAVLAAVLIPFWDLPIGYFEFQRHCWTEGGIHVYEAIGAQDKIFFVSDPSRSVNDMLKGGLKAVEILRRDGKGIAHHEFQQGSVVSRLVEKPESLIEVSITRGERLPWNIDRERQVARSLATHKRVASYASFSWYGGWLQESVAPLLQTRFKCARGADPLTALLQQGGR